MEPEYELISQGNTAKHWRLICEDTRRTLFYDAQAIQTVSAALRELGRLLFEFHSHKDFRLVQANSILGINLTVFGIVQRYRLATEQDLEDPSYRQHIGLIVLLIIAVFCAGLSPDPESIENFWRKHRIEKVNDRIHYVFENHAALVNHGPFHLIAAVVDVHTDRAFSRGMIFDCLHAVYAVYADQFLTADRHFVEMREKLVQFSSATGKIRHMDELRLNWIETSGPPPTKGWLDT